MLNNDLPPIGAILHDPGGNSEELLAAFALRLRQSGHDVGGLIQVSSRYANGRKRMELVDLRTGARFELSQNLGLGSDACCLDTLVLGEASAVLRREIAHGVALLVVNKFASEEGEGQGLAPEMLEGITLGIPLLTTLSRVRKPQWDAVMGGAGEMLESKEEALWEWWEGVAR